MKNFQCGVEHAYSMCVMTPRGAGGDVSMGAAEIEAMVKFFVTAVCSKMRYFQKHTVRR